LNDIFKIFDTVNSLVGLCDSPTVIKVSHPPKQRRHISERAVLNEQIVNGRPGGKAPPQSKTQLAVVSTLCPT
jgi:hypothetical protein